MGGDSENAFRQERRAFFVLAQGANQPGEGLTGGRYVAQVAGSQVCAIDPDSGLIDIVSPR